MHIIIVSIGDLISVTPGWTQAIFTAILVIITAFYAWQTHRQVVLFKRQMDREAKRHHTEILRLRVNDWLENLPTVWRTRAEPPRSFKGVGHPFFEEGKTFWTAPFSLQGDPYFEDLLDNHAERLASLKEAIETDYSEFQRLRNEFYEDYDNLDHLESLPFKIEVFDDFPLWAFESGILMERNFENLDERKENVVTAIENDKMAPLPPEKWYSGGLHNWDDSHILKAHIASSDERGKPQVDNDSHEQVIQAILDTLDDLPESAEYSLIEMAADTLDRVAENVSELERELSEYKGMEVYPGDCKYL